MSTNNNLYAAKSAKNDEFYTQLSDIEKDLNNYKDFFNGKIVYCNCDDPRESNFFKFFSLNFERLGLKKLITTGYKADGNGVAYIYEGDKNGNRMTHLPHGKYLLMSNLCQKLCDFTSSIMRKYNYAIYIRHNAM